MSGLGLEGLKLGRLLKARPHHPDPEPGQQRDLSGWVVEIIKQAHALKSQHSPWHTSPLNNRKLLLAIGQLGVVQEGRRAGWGELNTPREKPDAFVTV